MASTACAVPSVSTGDTLYDDSSNKPRRNSEHDSSTNQRSGRLPSKKRRKGIDGKRNGSFDGLASYTRNRNGSSDLSMSFSGRSRRESTDSSLALETMARSATQDATNFLNSESAKNLANVDRSHNALDHLDALAAHSNTRNIEGGNEEGSLASSGQRLLFEAMVSHDDVGVLKRGLGCKSSGDEKELPAPRERAESWGLPINGRDRIESWDRSRDRLESWGAMSDLSGAGEVNSTGLLAITSLPHFQSSLSLGAEERTSGLSSENHSKGSAIPSKIMVGRERLNSVASMSEASISNLPMLLDGSDMSSDIQAYVAAAIATVGDQIAEVAGAVEHVTNSTSKSFNKRESGLESDASSAASPMVGAISDQSRTRKRPRSLSVNSGILTVVDFDAVQAAVNATELIAGTEPMLRNAKPQKEDGCSTRQHRRRPLPTSRSRMGSTASDDSSRNEVSIGTRYLGPQRKGSDDDGSRAGPLKKRKQSVDNDMSTSKSSSPFSPCGEATPIPVVSSTYRTPHRTPRSGQANQKWDGMYECLLQFIEERKTNETKGLSEEEKSRWVWDGNVPTNYKTADGRALGRWVNNQRSAKGKGTLKEERELRLVQSGLRWSVLAAGSWNHMLDELKKYIKSQTKNGRKWDGNVPTNYQIKTQENSPFAGEDKNLGRWVNRQRSMYQSGKLKVERQQELEALGLKWSMLATVSWDSMYQTLTAYVQRQVDLHGRWDGNVPANYKTTDGRALGRWINRQRTSFAKNRLKAEYSQRLSAIGLKWSVHGKQGGPKTPSLRITGSAVGL